MKPLRIDQAIYGAAPDDLRRLADEFDLDDDERLAEALAHAYAAGARRGVVEVTASLIERGLDVRIESFVDA